jgi:hypothetical protein
MFGNKKKKYDEEEQEEDDGEEEEQKDKKYKGKKMTNNISEEFSERIDNKEELIAMIFYHQTRSLELIDILRRM